MTLLNAFEHFLSEWGTAESGKQKKKKCICIKLNASKNLAGTETEHKMLFFEICILHIETSKV